MGIAPEFARIAENTKIQSHVKYHHEYEKSKKKFTQFTDDPESMRVTELDKKEQ